MPDGTKRCPRCETVKPGDDFHRDARRADGLTFYCKACNRDRDRARGGQRKTVRRVLRVRANNRALAALRRAHPDEFDALYEEALEAVIEQHEMFLANAQHHADPDDPDAESPDPDTEGWIRPEPARGRYPAAVLHDVEQIPLLRPGPAVPGEPVEARLKPPGESGCASCKSRHERGHQCPVCGSKPQVMVQAGPGRRIRSTA
jgi:Zn finger protein HypA/HybF involved in hydrogenase expression